MADLAQCAINYDLSSSTNSESAMDFIVDKYDECRTKHTRCDASEELTPIPYPSRLLDVGVGEDEAIVLCDIGSIPKTGLEYVCLSHCWGIVKPYNLNRETESSLTGGISVRTLPKTFQDAVHMTRLLNIRYLWIDSL